MTKVWRVNTSQNECDVFTHIAFILKTFARTYLLAIRCKWHCLFFLFQSLVSELNMYESQMQEYKLDIDRLAEELKEVKKRYASQVRCFRLIS